VAPYVRAEWDHATTPNGVLGSKLMWNDFDSHRSSRRPPAVTDPGLEFMRTTFPDPQFVWLRRADKARQGISWWRAAVTNQWGLRPGQQAGQPPPDVEQMVQLVQSHSGARMAGGSGSHQPASSPAKSSTKISHGTGSQSRTQSWSSSASRNSM
jgi:LPS sulfotransferase NodH